MSWIAEPSVTELRAAVRRALPGLDGESIALQPKDGRIERRWHSGSAVIGGALVAKFAWSQVAAVRTYREGQILLALRRAAPQLQLPEVVATSADPVLVVTRIVAGGPLTSGAIAALDSAGVDRVAADLAGFLASLHDPSVLEEVALVAPMVAPVPQADTDSLRLRFGSWVSAQRRDTVLRWCDWVDTVLEGPSPSGVLVHGDLHGHNQVWDMEIPTLRAVVDLDNSGPIDAEFDFRYLPNQASETDLFAAVVRHYRRESGRDVDLERVMAWHVRTVLGDALWRSEAGIALPGGGDPTTWVDELAQRMVEAGFGKGCLGRPVRGTRELKSSRSGTMPPNATEEGPVASATGIGTAGLQGWRRKVGDVVAEPVAQRTPLNAEQVRAAVGALFFGLSVMYIVKTMKAASREAGGG